MSSSDAVNMADQGRFAGKRHRMNGRSSSPSAYPAGSQQARFIPGRHPTPGVRSDDPHSHSESAPTVNVQPSVSDSRNKAQKPNTEYEQYNQTGIVAEALLPPAPSSSLSSKLQKQIQHFLSDQVTPIRLASHLAVLAVAAVVLVMSQVELPNWQFSLRNLPENGLFEKSGGQPVALTSENPLATTNDNMAEAFHRAVVPFTELQQQLTTIQESAETASQAAPAAPAQRNEIETYLVKGGDTVLGIAGKFDLNPETIQWANPELEANPDMLRIGDRLVILPTDGVLHVVQPGDTLSAIATKYKVAPQSLVDYPLNHLETLDTPLTVGSQIIVPNGTKPYIARQVLAYNGPVPAEASKGSGNFSWPTSGTITQPYWNGHRALDIGAWLGTAVKAADSGYVIVARTGWNSGYGSMVMVDHGNGYVTLYGHLNSIYVRQGESVGKGQQIGAVGSTGNSTGPHLHFEVRYQGVPRNPFIYLP